MSSSRQPSMSCSSGSNFDEFQWVSTIRRTLEKEDEDDTDEITVSIFTVPKTLMSCHPDFYTRINFHLGYAKSSLFQDGGVGKDQSLGALPLARLLYDIMVPRVDELLIDVTAEDVEENRYETEQENRSGSGIDFSHVKSFLSDLWNTVSELNIGQCVPQERRNIIDGHIQF
uniref:Uncharacterized protein n=1 Tax=Salix viminalis TaxID=40686 RepID=A0A6N2MXK2_SALVM